jgi:predicted nucleic acid-binding protein
MALILDTGPLYASLDRKDRDYHRCRSLIEGTNETLLVPAPVLPEVDYLVSERMGPAPMLALIRDIESNAYRVEDLLSEDYTRVRELMDQYADLDLGFVDAAVLVLAERLQERKVATLDRRHFSVVRLRHVAALELVPG